eukprot:gene3706-4646_t
MKMMKMMKKMMMMMMMVVVLLMMRGGDPSHSNPTNRMWKLLRLGGIIPDEWGPEDNNNMPSMLGVGLTDLGTEPGNDEKVVPRGAANSYKRAKMREWRSDLYGRLEAHLARVAACSAPGSAGDQGAEVTGGVECGPGQRTEGRHSPAVVAFTGKRQYGQGVYIALGKRISYETWERVTVQ